MAEISVATYSLTEGDNGAQVSIVFSDGTAETVTDKHANFQSIVQALINKPEGYGPVVYDLANIAKTVGRKFRNLSDRVTTDGAELFFDGDAIDGTLSQFILKLLREDAEKAAVFFSGGQLSADDEESTTTWEALVKFLELLYANPNPQSRESLYEFIRRYGLTIRKDGHFIAYKGLQSDFGSINKGYGIVDGVEVNGTLFNKPGSVLRFPRKDVDSNTAVGCSQGLHAGTHDYATKWARGGKLVAVAISPTNVVSVPDDCTFQKLRVCEYEILNEVDPLEDAVATSGWGSSSYWADKPKDWDDNYNGVLDGVRVGDSVAFDYVSIDGREQTIDEAKVEEVSGDYIRTFVPAKDGYRTFTLEGISNFVNFTQDEEAEEEEYDEDEDDYSDYEDGYPELEDEDDGSEEDDVEPHEDDAPQEKPKAQTWNDLLNEAKERIDSGAGAPLNDIFKGAQDFLSGDLKAKAEKVLRDSGLTDVVDAFKEGLQEGGEDATADLAEGSIVSFDYIASSGESQRISDAKVEEVQAEYFKAFVPSKDGYRTFKFDGVSNLKNSVVKESAQSNSEIRGIFDGLKTNDTVSVELDKDGELLKLDGATVLIHSGSTLTVRLKQGGYKAFTVEDVRSISKN